MNDKRRREIAKLTIKLTEILREIEQVRDDEQAAFDNTSPSLRQAPSGEKMKRTFFTLDDACQSCEEVIEHLNLALK